MSLTDVVEYVAFISRFLFNLVPVCICKVSYKLDEIKVRGWWWCGMALVWLWYGFG
jgi:hypothetical protein